MFLTGLFKNKHNFNRIWRLLITFKRLEFLTLGMITVLSLCLVVLLAVPCYYLKQHLEKYIKRRKLFWGTQNRCLKFKECSFASNCFGSLRSKMRKISFHVHHVGLLLGWALLALVAMRENDVIKWFQFVHDQYLL